MKNNEEKKDKIYYNNVEAKFYFGDVCPPIPQSVFFLDKEKEENKNVEHTS